MKRRNTKGFTLGEVLLVVAIISALTAIGIPSLMKEIDKAKLRVDQAHVQEAVSMATSQYAADHESVTVVYYYDANRSEIQKENRNIYGYGKSTKEPYKHNTHVTDSTVPVNDDGTRNLVRVTVTKQSGEFSIESSWVPAAVNGETPPPTSTPVTTPDPNKKTFGDVEITAAGSWPVKEVDFPESESQKSVNWGYVYTYNGDYYLMRHSPGYTYNYDSCVSPSDNGGAWKLTSDLFSNILSEADVIEKNKKGEVGVNLIVKSNSGRLYITQNGWDLVGADGKIKFDITEKFCPIYGAVLKRK